MRVLSIAVVGALVAGGVTLAVRSTAAGAETGAGSKIVDRTVSCAVGLTGGIHKVELTANTGTRVVGKPSVWKLLSNVGVEDLGTGASANVSGGNPTAPLAPGFPAEPERLLFSAPPVCKRATRILFSRKGLVPVSVTALPQSFGSGINCYPGKRVIYRVRGIFRVPTSLHVKRYQGQPFLLAASGTVTVGYLAVRSASGKPLAYGEVFENGKATLFVARSCDR